MSSRVQRVNKSISLHPPFHQKHLLSLKVHSRDRTQNNLPCKGVTIALPFSCFVYDLQTSGDYHTGNGISGGVLREERGMVLVAS